MPGTARFEKIKMKTTKKLGFGGLVALVFGMMVGAGIYNIPQNMAVSASQGAVIIAWLVTAACILSLVATFKTLADRRPDLNAGIYEYAQAGFGNYTGFNMAWGYWLSTCIANIAYAAMLNDSFGVFFPALLHHGWQTLVFGTVLIWLMCWLVLKGIKAAKTVNFIMAVLKVAAIAFILVLLWINAKMGLFTADFFGSGDSGIGGIGEQVKNTMMVTLFCFVGIEGAVMMSARAKNPRSVGRAGVVGFALAWLLYVLISLLSFAVMTRGGLASLGDPSAAYLLRDTVGEWAYYFVIISVIVSLLGGWVAWNLVCSQCSMEAAEVGIFPRHFLKMNSKGMPSFATIASAAVMEMFLVVVIFSDDFYLAAVSITGMMVLPPYLFSGLYLTKASFRPAMLGNPGHGRLMRFRFAGIACTVCCLWMIWSGGLDLLLESTLFYLPGIVFYLLARAGRRFWTPKAMRASFTRAESVELAVIVAGASSSLILLFH